MNSQSREWQAFFDAHAVHYDENPFTHHTRAEVDFLLNLYPLAPGASILDIGCGTGRHSVELARRGYNVTGLDLSEGMLSVARSKSLVEGVQVDWVQGDATIFELDRQFDLAICLCEGGPGLLEAGEDPEVHEKAIFTQAAKHLKAHAPFIMTCLNGYSVIRQLNDQAILDGMFNPGTMYSQYEEDWALPEGPKRMRIQERLFIAPEVVRMLRESGFQVDNVFGGTAGHWGQRPLSLDEVEAMYVCRKK